MPAQLWSHGGFAPLGRWGEFLKPISRKRLILLAAIAHRDELITIESLLEETRMFQAALNTPNCSSKILQSAAPAASATVPIHTLLNTTPPPALLIERQTWRNLTLRIKPRTESKPEIIFSNEQKLYAVIIQYTNNALPKSAELICSGCSVANIGV
jgi:hypothetical protein